MIDENRVIIPIVRDGILAHIEMLSKAFDGYFTCGELKISEE